MEKTIEDEEGYLDKLQDYASKTSDTIKEYGPSALSLAADFTPVVGDVKGAYETYEAIEEGDYIGAGINGVATAVGVIPLVGDAAARGLKGAEPVIREKIEDVSENIFGNSKVSSRTDDVLEGENPYEAIDMTPDEVQVWKDTNKVDNRFAQIPEVEEAAKQLRSGNITSDQFREISVGAGKPTIFEEVPKIPSLKGLVLGLDKKKVDKGIVGLNKKIEDGERVASRLDIPAYNTFDKWVVSLHGGGKSGKSAGYAQTARLKDVTMQSNPNKALKVAEGSMSKSPFARMDGKWVNHDSADIVKEAGDLLKDPEWTQIGMNPYRASYFYDKETMEAVVEAKEIVQIGPLVLGKGVKKVSPNDSQFKIKPDEPNSPTFNEGGLMSVEMITDELNPITEHHFENIATGNVVENEDGTTSTVKTTIIGRDDMEYLLPTVWGGTILEDPSEIIERAFNEREDWPSAPAGEEGVRELEELDQRIHEQYMNGPTVSPEEAQSILGEGSMEEVDPLGMEEVDPLGMYGGGMASEGCGDPLCSFCGDMSVGMDGISGNPIPPGSNEMNVRDDIPAVLSDGEYVVPADVVRYHGLKTFMSLRDEAKMGLMSMYAEGQIQTLEEEYSEGEYEEGCGEDYEEEEVEDEEYETPEDNVIEKAEPKIEEETMEVEEEEEDEESSSDGKNTYRPSVKIALMKK